MTKYLFLLIFLISAGLSAQTSLSCEDIQAQSGNQYEWLLTNVGPNLQTGSIQGFLQKKLKMTDDIYYYRKTVIAGNPEHRYFYKISQGKKKTKELFYHIIEDKNKVVQKVVIEGDWQPVVRFFVGFWTNDLNFDDIKPGQTVSTRFLTDVATLEFTSAKKAKITVVTASDR